MILDMHIHIWKLEIILMLHRYQVGIFIGRFSDGVAFYFWKYSIGFYWD